MQDYSGKTVIITGAGSGMGRAMSVEFSRRGAQVAAIGRNIAKLNETREATGGKALIYSCDVAHPLTVENTIATILRDCGRLDILINNAGILDSYAPAHEVSVEEWNAIIATNLTGPFLMAKAVIPQMLAQGKGVILNVASVASFSAAGGGSAYTASKHGVQGLMKQLCFEYGAKGIRVNEICPGATATPLAMPEGVTAFSPDMEAAVARVPARRWCQPEEIAGLAAFLAGDQADYIHGSSYVIDGGWLTAAREAF